MKWYHSPWAIAVAIILFFPVGFIMLWVSPRVASWAKVVVPSIFLGIFLIADGESKKEQAQQQAEKSQISQSVEDPLEAARQDSIREVERAQAMKQLDVLKQKFIFEGDDFSGGGWYYHKRWGTKWPHRNTLMVHVNSNGDMDLVSNYWSDDWLFHTKAQIKIGDHVHSTSEVSRRDKKNHSEVVTGGVYEVLYLDSYQDIAIIHLLSRSVEEKQEVKVRLQGDQYYKDYTLSNADKLAIKECYDLASLISLTQSTR